VPEPADHAEGWGHGKMLLVLVQTRSRLVYVKRPILTNLKTFDWYSKRLVDSSYHDEEGKASQGSCRGCAGQEGRQGEDRQAEQGRA